MSRAVHDIPDVGGEVFAGGLDGVGILQVRNLSHAQKLISSHFYNERNMVRKRKWELECGQGEYRIGKLKWGKGETYVIAQNHTSPSVARNLRTSLRSHRAAIQGFQIPDVSDDPLDVGGLPGLAWDWAADYVAFVARLEI